MRLPSDDPEAWNTLTLDGKRCPGKVVFPAFTVERKVDAKESAGSESFALTDKGGSCTTVDVEFHLWTAEHFADFTPLYAAYLDPRRPLKKRSVVSVSHPSLYAAGIKLLYFNAAEGLQPLGGEQGRVYAIKAKGLEFNAKTRLGGGSTKPKPAPSYSGQGGKWTTGALGSAPVYGPPADAATKPAPPPAQTLAQQQAKAAKGDARAQFVSKVAEGWAPVVIGG